MLVAASDRSEPIPTHGASQSVNVDQDEEVVYSPAATDIAKVDQVPIEPFLDCRNIAASLEFYTKVLDFNLVVAPDPDPQQFGSRYAAVSRDGDMLHLSSHSRENGAFGAAVYVRVENVDELCERFVQNGVKLSVPDGGNTPVNQSWGMREIGFRDPDGNKLTFGQAIA